MRKAKWLRRDKKLHRRKYGMRTDKHPREIIQSIINRSEQEWRIR